MRLSFTATCFLLAAIAAIGCRPAEEPTSPDMPTIQQPATQEPEDVNLAMLRYDTGDVKKWPDYNFQLEHSFEVPEVPPEIVGPFSTADIPAGE